jgi:hypothetical protein
MEAKIYKIPANQILFHKVTQIIPCKIKINYFSTKWAIICKNQIIVSKTIFIFNNNNFIITYLVFMKTKMIKLIIKILLEIDQIKAQQECHTKRDHKNLKIKS